MKKNKITPCDKKAVLYQKKNTVEAVDLFSRLSPDLQDTIIELVKTMINKNQNNK